MFEPGEDGIGKLLTSLPRVDAPGDFDFRVRARIAAGRPARGRVSWLPASVRIAIPLVLVLAVGYVAFNAYYLSGGIDGPVVVVSETQNFAPVSGPPANDGTVLPTNVQPADLIAVKPPEMVNQDAGPWKTVSPDSKVDRPRGGSYVGAIRPSRNLTPPGMDNNANLLQAPKPAVQPSDREVLASAGIQAVSAAGGWKVQSVTAGGSAERSGVMAGDFIRSILEGRTLTIRRDGKPMRIDLKP